MDWDFLNTGENTAAYNMALDESLFLLYKPALVNPLFRIYAFSRPSVTLGYGQEFSQNPWKRQPELAIVRRITGGKAVLHANDLTYSIILPDNYLNSGHHITTSYLFSCRAFVNGLKSAGIDCSIFSMAETSGEITSEDCFEKISAFEIKAENRKILGCALKKTGNKILQQGTLQLQRVAPSDTIVTWKQREKWGHSLRRGLEETYEITFKSRMPTPEEIELTGHLIETRYSRDEWNMKVPGSR
jgi:lipoate-protein ligase A